MLAVKFSVECAPAAQAALREVAKPVREEWQQDGSWTGLFDVDEATEEALYDLIEDYEEHARTREIESEDEIPGFRMALYLF